MAAETEQLDLTPRQCEVLGLRLSGYTCRDIAERDKKSYQSVKMISSIAQRKLNKQQRAAYLDALKRSRKRHVFRPIQLSLCL